MSKYPKWLRHAVIVFVLVVCGAVVEAQQPNKMQRIGYLSALDPARESARAKEIRQALRDRGYIDGQNIAIEYRYTEGKVDRAPELAAELVRLEVDIVFVAGGDRWIVAAKRATNTIPIVMIGGGLDPVEAGLVESLARPGGNITGITNVVGKLGGKRLELLKEAIPKLAGVAVLYNPTSPANALELKLNAVNTCSKRSAAPTSQACKDRADALYVAQGPLMNANQKRIVNSALKLRIPSVYVRRDFVDAGGLMSYGADFADSYRRVASYVEKILKGAKPAALPVEQPTKFELVINLKTAKQIGVTIPQNVLARADRVIR